MDQSNFSYNTGNDQHSVLSEFEVNDIIRNCNLSLSNVTTEHDQLQADINKFKNIIEKSQKDLVSLETQWKKLSVKCEHEQSIYQKFQEEQEEFQLFNKLKVENLEPELFEKDPTVKKIKKLIQIAQNSDKDENKKQIIISHLQEQLKVYIRNLKLKKINNILDEFNENRIQNLQFNKLQKNRKTFCQRCKQLFTPSENKHDACFYHPGKLKYYSCRQCGADDYYTCCNSCSRCNKGCQNNSHVL